MSKKRAEMPRTGRHFGWMVPKDDGTFDTGFHAIAFGDDLWEEYNRIVQVAPDLRPAMIDFRSLQGDYEELSAIEDVIRQRIDGMPNQFSLGGAHLIESHSFAQRALSNFLGSASAFRDRELCRLSERHGKFSEQYLAFKRATNEQFDNSFAYRLFCYLRNFAQHRNSPISIIPVNAKRDDAGIMRCDVLLKLDRGDVLSGEKLPARLRAELNGHAEGQYDLVSLAHEYMSCVEALMKVVIDQEADRLIEMAHYAKAVLKAHPLPEGAIPLIWDGELPGPGERNTTVHYFSFDELELILRLRHHLDEKGE